MIFYSDKNVYEAALERFRYIFNEFYGKRPIVVTISGGKDSTVCLYLVKEIMDEMGIEKIPVLFLDQEAETPMTVEYIRYIMHLPWVEPYWVQSYFQEWNASKGDWFNVWGPGEQWCREKEPNNPYADMDLKVHQYFTHTLACAQKTIFGKSFVSIGGVRIEESPARLSGLTHGDVYNGITWGGGGGYYKDGTPRSMVLYPIWDWKVNDVWYYIFSKKIPYNKLYNYEFTQKPLRACRVSSLIHENAIHDVAFIKEVDPKFYNKLQKRVMNLNSVVQAHNSLIYWCDHLPPYFKDWDEYVNYLAENISEKKENGQKIVKMYRKVRDKWLEKMGTFQDGIKYTEDFVGWYGCVCIIAEDFVGSRFRNVDRTMLQYYNDHYKEIKLAEIESKKQNNGIKGFFEARVR